MTQKKDNDFWLVLRYEDDNTEAFPVGIFDNEKTATHMIEELLETFKENKFELIQLTLNTVYIADGDQDKMDDLISLTVESLVKNGIADYKIGEDGNFYFELTEDGKKALGQDNEE